MIRKSIGHMEMNYYFCNKNKKHVMLTIFKKYIDSKGFRIQSEDETTISFERNGLQYTFVYEKSDPYYFRVILPNILKVNTENEQEILQLVNTINLKFKVAKSVIVEEKNVWISIESFVYSTNNMDDFFDRIFILYEVVINEYKEYLNLKKQ